MADSNVDRGKRRFLVVATGVMGGVAGVAVAVPFAMSMNPSARARAAGAPVEVDISKVEPGMMITINMAPADIRKEGSSYDLTLAIGILVASGQLKGDVVDKYIIMGELSLDGSLQPIKGALPIAQKA